MNFKFLLKVSFRYLTILYLSKTYEEYELFQNLDWKEKTSNEGYGWCLNHELYENQNME